MNRLTLLVSCALSTVTTLLTAAELTPNARELVGQALQAESNGDLVRREQLLGEASRIDSGSTPARWYQGQIISRTGDWLSIDEFIEKSQSDKLLAEYELMRAQQPATIAGNWNAAKWCAKHQLGPQCRAHLENILLFDPDNAAARKILGHLLVGNDWLSTTDQQRMAHQASITQQGFIKFHPVVKELLAKAQTNPTLRELALAELKAIDDPLAIPVMESLVGGYDREFAKLAIDWLGLIDDQQASLSLARIALLSIDTELRNFAVAQLKKKSQYDYIPDLLAAMSSPILFQTVPVITPNGQLAGFRQAFAREGMKDFQLVNSETTVQRTNLAFGIPSPANSVAPSEDLADELAALNAMNAQMMAFMVQADLNSRQAKAARDNQLIAERNSAISRLVSEIAETEFTNIPYDVWAWWDQQNETDYQRRKYTRQQYNTNRYYLPNYYARLYQPPTTPPRVSSADLISVDRRQGRAHQTIGAVPLISCFVAGTKINTQRGLREIENILPGDLVLSRDVATGELCYKPVIRTTSREPAKTVVLRVDDETIQATTNHLLWVSGKGWTKAGDVKPGKLLHAAAEPAVVLNVLPGPNLPTYNLVVADTHTYFVGSSKILSHDVLPRGPVHELIPGQFAFTAK